MSFTIPASYPTPLVYSGPPDVIRALTLQTLVERDRFIFAKQRRMLTALSPFWTTNTSYEQAAQFWVHNSKLTEGSVTVAAYGYNATIKVIVNGASNTLGLYSAPSYDIISLPTGWTDDSWIAVEVMVQSNTGATGGFFGLYILEDALTVLP